MRQLHVRFCRRLTGVAALLAACVSLAVRLHAAEQSSATALAEKLETPVADLISVQFQNNFDFGVGENNGTLYLLNFQPVIPLHITSEWNYIVRPVLPFISSSNVYGPGYVTGLGDLEVEAFFSSVKPGPFGIIWGLGPTAILPTATQSELGDDVMTLGPSGVVLWQRNGWTVGSLVTQNWRVAGLGEFNSSYFQPFVSHTFKTATTLGVVTNSPTYDWHMTNLRNYITVNPNNVQSGKIGKLELQAFGMGNGMWGLPGDFSPPSRFVRAALFSANAIPSDNAAEGIDHVFHILNNFDLPRGIARTNQDGTISADFTQMTTARDPQNLRFYYKTYDDQTIRMIDMKKLDLDAKEIKKFAAVSNQPIVDMSSQLK